MRIQGAIFDMDGTLLDSMYVWDTLAAEYLSRRGISPCDGLVGILEHMTLAEAADYLKGKYCLPEAREEILSGFEETVDILYEGASLKEGVLPMLLAFRRAGVRMAIATLTDRPRALRVLGRLGILDLFDTVLTCEEVGEGKRSPRIYLEALSRLGTEKAVTPVFEDAYYAICTAHAAGFPIVSVYDPSSACRFDDAAQLADLAVRDYRDVDFCALIG